MHDMNYFASLGILCVRDAGSFPFNPKFQKFRLVGTEHYFRFGPTGILGTSFEGGPLGLVRLSCSVGPKCPFPFDKIVIPSTALLYPPYKNNNKMRWGVGRVCATGMYWNFC